MPESRRRRGRGATRAAGSGNVQGSPRRKTNKWYLGASIIIAVLVIASFAFASFSGGGSAISTGEGNEYIKGVGVQHDIMPTSKHLPETETINYSTTPPTSGDHWATPQACGFYEDGVPDERATHNLEHGNIVVSYNLPLEADVQALRSAMNSIGLANMWGISRFYPDIEPGTVSLAAWGVLDTMQGADRDRITRFFESYFGALGPEIIPCSGVQAPHVK